MLAKFPLLKPYRIYRGVKLIFDTKRKQFENSCLVFTNSIERFEAIIGSPLFNKQYIRGFYIDRFLDKTLYRRLISTDRLNLYKRLKEETDLTILPLSQGVLRNKNCYFGCWLELINLFNIPGAKNKMNFMRNFALTMQKIKEKINPELYKENYVVIDANLFDKEFGDSEPKWIKGLTIGSLLYLHVRDILARKAYNEFAFAGKRVILYDPVSTFCFMIPPDISKLSLGKFRWMLRLMQKAVMGDAITQEDLAEGEDAEIHSAVNSKTGYAVAASNTEKPLFYPSKEEAMENFAHAEYPELGIFAADGVVTVVAEGKYEEFMKVLEAGKLRMLKTRTNLYDEKHFSKHGLGYFPLGKDQTYDEETIKISKDSNSSCGLKFKVDSTADVEEIDKTKKKYVSEIGGMKNALPLDTDEKELVFSINDRMDEILSDKQLTEFDEVVKKDTELNELRNQLSTKRLLDVQNKKSSEVIEKLEDKQRNATVTIDGKDIKLEEKLKALEKTSLKPLELPIQTVNEELKTTTMRGFRHAYMEDLYDYDQFRIFTRFKESKDIPIYVESINKDDTSDSMNEKNTMEIRFNIAGERPKSMKIDVPKIDQDGYMYLQGSRRQITNQITVMPISKVEQSGELVVMYSTAYNKIFLSRSGGNFSRNVASLIKAFERMTEVHKNSGTGYSVMCGSSLDANDGFLVSLEYYELSKKLISVTIKDLSIFFSQKRVQEALNKMNADLDALKELFPEDKYFPMGTLSGKIPVYGGRIEGIFVPNADNTEMTQVARSIDEIIRARASENSELSKYISENIYSGKNFGYTKLEVSNAYIPLLVFLGFKDGLEKLFETYDIEYVFIPKDKTSKVMEIPEGYDEKVQFKDGMMYYKPNSVKKNLLFYGIYQMDTKNFNLRDFNADGEAYYSYFIEEVTPRYGKALQNFYTLFIDPITEDILKDNDIPHDVTGSFLYCNDLLEDAAYLKRCDMNLYRIRNVECINALLYKLVAKQIEKYRRGSRGDTAGTLAVRSDALIQEINTSPLFEDATILNPVKETDNLGKAVYKGPGAPGYQHPQGTEEIRFFDKSMRGIFGVSSSFDSDAGMNRRLSVNTLITSKRGYLKPNENIENLNATNLYAIGDMVNSFSARHADPERMMMTAIQTGHQIPTVDMDQAIVTSGVYKVIPYTASNEFAFKAPEDGEVTKINKKLNIMELKYSDGSKGFVELGVKYRRSPDGFFVCIQQEPKFKEHQKFKKGHIVAADKHFFTGDSDNIEMYQGTLAKVACMGRDVTYEDSSCITQTLADKLKSQIVMQTQLNLSPSSNLISIAHVGQNVRTSENLAVFEENLEDSSISEALGKMSDIKKSLENIAQNVKTSKFTGKIVDIEIFWDREITEYSKSLQKLIRAYIAANEEKMDALKGVRSDEFVEKKSLVPVKNGKAKGTIFEGILINFYIEIEEDFSVGDKLTYQTALKSVVGQIIPKGKEPFTKRYPNEPLEGCISSFGVFNRKVPDFLFTLAANKVFVELKRKIIEMAK